MPCRAIIFFLGAGIQRGEPFAHDDVESRAGAGLFARMVEFDSGGEQTVANGGAACGIQRVDLETWVMASAWRSFRKARNAADTRLL
jgi:hypothetical protein